MANIAVRIALYRAKVTVVATAASYYLVLGCTARAPLKKIPYVAVQTNN